MSEAVFIPDIPGLGHALTLFRTTLDELLSECEAHEPPQVVANLIVAVLQKPLKLSCWVGNDGSAVGASRIDPGFYASDLFVELVQAVRALQWEVVVVILEQALSPLTPTPSDEDR
jgi:hypothetical protein